MPSSTFSVSYCPVKTLSQRLVEHTIRKSNTSAMFFTWTKQSFHSGLCSWDRNICYLLTPPSSLRYISTYARVTRWGNWFAPGAVGVRSSSRSEDKKSQQVLRFVMHCKHVSLVERVNFNAVWSHGGFLKDCKPLVAFCIDFSALTYRCNNNFSCSDKKEISYRSASRKWPENIYVFLHIHVQTDG